MDTFHPFGTLFQKHSFQPFSTLKLSFEIFECDIGSTEFKNYIITIGMKLFQIILVSAILFEVTQEMKVMIASGCFWDEIGPNLAVVEELLVLGHEVVYASPAECNSWITEYYGVEKLDTDGPGNSDLKRTINLYETETGYGEDTFYNSEADDFLFYRYCDMYQTIHEYLNNNSVDVIFVTFNAIGALLAAEVRGTPVLMNYNSLVLTTLTEHCSNCGYTKALPRLYYSGRYQLNILQEFIMSVLWNLAPLSMWRRDSFLNTKRVEIGLKSYYPKSATLRLEATYPKVYTSLHPILLEVVHPPDGRWVVGPLVSKSTGGEVTEELERFLSLSDKPVVLLSTGEMLQLSGLELQKLLSVFRGEKDYRVVWLLDSSQQDVLADQMSTGDNLLVEHPNSNRGLLRDERIELVVAIAGYSYIVEACLYSKPMVLIPVLNEQKKSAELLEELGCSETMSYSDISGLPSLIEFMLAHAGDYTACLERVKTGTESTGGARLVVDILERMAVSGYNGMDLNFQISSVPDVINSLLAIVLLLLQGSLILLLVFLVSFHVLYREQGNTEEPNQKDKQD